MLRLFALVYGLVCYGVFFATFLYLIGFVGNLVVPKTIDSHASDSLAFALVVNTLLVLAFAVQHTIMARPGFKQKLTTWLPAPLERSTYVLVASLFLILLFWGWQGLPRTIWSVEAPLGQGLIYALFAAGWLIVLLSTFLINHFDLFGLRQVFLFATNRSYTSPEFRQTLLYNWVRHPLMSGFVLAFWATPTMSLGHLQFAILMTLYILIGIRIEERDLIAKHGSTYLQYRDEVPALCPFGRRTAR
ncbi:protein-S-isoprenylcysteine O-methyltransferase Ste14 [Methylohalomonas lacus]|uniref:methanethiol S-methyltransferase n=1 Tax=Methylohalomonas lacus TaxID=398773 RepID=A0AAE3HLR5_9GAMM|nr:methanethiol S-methyltransferase [Methylohalomonas lacus]MCS3904085.1 protein-S-isoprenylcysteine O-methyltransferase Ste14 [Methylohalomonas lacus]